MEKVRIVRSQMLADALVWFGFEYTRNEKDEMVFERTGQFEMVWDELHRIKSLYCK